MQKYKRQISGLMKIYNLLLLVPLLGLTQCGSTEIKSGNIECAKINMTDIAGNYPIKDLITDIPALDENAIDPIVLEDSALSAIFDRNSGRLVRLVNKKTGWKIQRREYLSRSFRLSVPVPGRRDNCVYGELQSHCMVEISKDNKKVTFIWDTLTSECARSLNIRFAGTVQLSEGELQFTAEVANNSPYTVEAVYWPYIGDLNAPDKPNTLSWKYIVYGGTASNSIYPYFNNNKGYWGVDYPIQNFTLYSHFGLLGNDNEGLYLGYNDTTNTQLINITFELKPGWYDDSGTVPMTDSIGGKPSRIEYSCVHLVYINPNETGTLKGIILKPYEGDWQKGADNYKEWRKTWMRTPPCPEWVKKVHSWQQLHINSSEDYPRCSFRDLVVYARECAKYGVKAIQLTGWNIGGQDRGNPLHDPDPRLGTLDDLKNAISECQKIGVHIILFSKFTWADESQPWFKNELVKYAAKDPYGNYYSDGGYQYQTAAQLADINTRRLVPMCHLSPEWRNVADSEFTKLIDLGADGMLYDECQHHGSAFFCFDPSHKHHVPGNIYSGDALLENGFRKIAGLRKPDFLFAGEAVPDLEFRSYNLSYYRIGDDHVPMHRYVAPETRMMIAITGYNARYPLNQALLYNYIISYEPRYFKGHLDEFPMTMAYGKKIDELRERYSDFLWDGEFVGSVGANVKVEKADKAIYSVFINHKTDKKAVVVANPSRDKSISVKVATDYSNGRFMLATPENPEPKKSGGKVKIPATSVVVLFEN